MVFYCIELMTQDIESHMAVGHTLPLPPLRKRRGSGVEWRGSVWLYAIHLYISNQEALYDGISNYFIIILIAYH